MKREHTGDWITVTTAGAEPVRAFVPRPLPPQPPLKISRSLRTKLDNALVSLGRLDGITALLPDTGLFLYMYIRKEAVLSSQIEGTQSSLADLLLFELDEAPGVPLDDVKEVSRYVAALQYGLKRMRDGFPLSNRLFREIHGVLLAKGRGADKTPGEFRRSQNWIGGTRPGNAVFVPPPADRIAECMGALERFLHDEEEASSVLVKAALVHAQFESIHPFLDGNGRLGRLLITLLLCGEGVLSEPLLYLSLYLKAHRTRYYELLQQLRTDGEWEIWLEFFAEGVRETADTAVSAARRIVALFDKDQVRIQALGRPAGSALRIHQRLQRMPLTSIGDAANESGLSIPTTNKSMRLLEKLGIVEELTGKQRNRIFVYRKHFDVLNEEPERTAADV